MYKKKKRGRPNAKSPEFRMMVCQEIEAGMTYKEASKTFGVSNGSLAAWLKQYRAGKLLDPKAVEDSRSRIERLTENIDELKAEIAELYLQNQVLKKAIAYMNSKVKKGSFVITQETMDQYRTDVD